MAAKQGEYTRLRFRSSTNAEDARGFSGAGLYTSRTAILGDSIKTVEKAIKKVWSSLWNERAYLERELYHINHKQVFMGILVHRSFPDEHANGVAITANLYRPENNGFVINVQLGEQSVVKPDSGVVCDQFVCYPPQEQNLYSQNNTIEVITLSNLNNGHMVLNTDEITQLAKALYIVKQHFYYTPLGVGDYLKFALDIEFKFDGPNNTLYLKQARIYPN
jgi:phosphoenolpyruvate synthase/pyruvate phosphate dikinase